MKNYIELGKKILEKGCNKDDRTGTGTKALFGEQLRFDLSKGFPAVTTKKLAFKTVVGELLWFLSGSTDRRDLQRITTGSFSDTKHDIWKLNAVDANVKDPYKFDGYTIGNMYGRHWRNKESMTLEPIFIDIKNDTDVNYLELYADYYGKCIYDKHSKSGCDFIHETNGKTYTLLGRTRIDDVYYFYFTCDKGITHRIIGSEVNLGKSLIKSHRDPYIKNSMGGYLGSPYEQLRKDPLVEKVNVLWYNMLSRVENSDYYSTISVSPRWLNFSNFLSDIRNIPFFTQWLNDPSSWELDKDYYGSSVYSRNTCIFVPKFVNQMMIRKNTYNCIYVVDGHKFLDDVSVLEYTGIDDIHSVLIEKTYPLNDRQVIRPRLVTDQISLIIDLIKNDPNNRRIIVESWNVNPSDNSVLATCHPFFQFFVNNGKLSCSFTQRSSDYFLGLPINLASYALLTHMLALECGLEVGELICNIGDAHIYNNHIDQVNELISREPFPLPTLRIKEKKNFFEYSVDDFELVDYNHHPEIKAKMAV